MRNEETKNGAEPLFGAGAPEKPQEAAETGVGGVREPEDVQGADSGAKRATEADRASVRAISVEAADELALAQYEEANRAGFPTAKILGVMAQFAQHVVVSGQHPATIDSAAKMVMVFQMGRELGIPPMKALYSFYFVNNKLTMFGPTVIERIRRWARIEYGDCTVDEANITITRKDDGTSLSARVTMAELKERGSIDGKHGVKDTFKKHPRTMLIYKAVGEIVRHIVPEAVGGVAVEGDWGGEAEYEIRRGQERRGKLAEPQGEEPDAIFTTDGDIPTVPQIVRKYDIETLKKRAVELGVEVEGRDTKGKLAAAIVEKLRERYDEAQE